MDRVFQAITDGLAKFLYGWVLPSAIALGAMLFLLPDLAHRYPAVESAVDRLPQNNLQQILVFGLATVALSTALSLTIANPLTQLLEGYFRHPSALRRWLRARQVRAHRRLNLLASRRDTPPDARTAAQDSLLNYPRNEAELLPTRLGNYLRASELFGNDVYELDVLEFWDEIFVSASPNNRAQIEDQRSAFDFYISAIANSLAVVVFALAVAVLSESLKAYIVAAISVAVLPLLYVSAIAQAGTYGAALRSLVNLSRRSLGREFGFELPASHRAERTFWRTLSWGLYGQPGELDDLDSYRLPASPTDGPVSRDAPT